MKLNTIRSASLYFWFIFVLHTKIKAAPSNENLSKILGYPSSELVVDNITDKEKALWTMPTARERKGKIILGPSSEKLYAAYRVSGKNPQTFYPIIIWIAGEGTFMTDQLKTTFIDLSKEPSLPITMGGKGPFGIFSIDSADMAGLYAGKIKCFSRNKEIFEPLERMSLISVIHLSQQKIDVRIAIMGVSTSLIARQIKNRVKGFRGPSQTL